MCSKYEGSTFHQYENMQKYVVKNITSVDNTIISR